MKIKKKKKLIALMLGVFWVCLFKATLCKRGKTKNFNIIFFFYLLMKIFKTIRFRCKTQMYFTFFTINLTDAITPRVFTPTNATGMKQSLLFFPIIFPAFIKSLTTFSLNIFI